MNRKEKAVTTEQWEREQERIWQTLSRPHMPEGVPVASLKVTRMTDRDYSEIEIDQIREANKFAHDEQQELSAVDDMRLRDEVKRGMDRIGETLDELFVRGMSQVAVLSALVNETSFLADAINNPDPDDPGDEYKAPLFNITTRKAVAA
jgi:hypothetical protein